jgi:hypothetical protein
MKKKKAGGQRQESEKQADGIGIPFGFERFEGPAEPEFYLIAH